MRRKHWPRKGGGLGLGLGVGGGGAYLINDSFLTDIAAGSVNGTYANPGPGKRVVDDRAVLSLALSGGWASFGPGNAAADGVPGLWLTNNDGTGLTPFQGITIISQIKGDGNAIYAAVGSDVNTATHLTNNSLFIENNVILGSAGTATGILGNINANETISVAIAISGSNGHTNMYIKTTTTYPQWTFLKDIDTGAITSWYPATNKQDSGYLNTHYCRFIRVPTVGYMPAPIASDAFGSTFGVTDGLGHGISSGTGAGGSGVAWTQQAGVWGITSSRAYSPTVPAGGAIATVPLGTANQWVMSKFYRSYNSIGLVVRFTDLNNYIKVEHDGTNIICTEIVVGAPNVLFTTEAAYVAGAFLYVITNGNNIKVQYNNYGYVNNSTTALLTGNNAGLYNNSTSASNSLDNFQARALGNEGQYGYFDKFLH